MTASPAFKPVGLDVFVRSPSIPSFEKVALGDFQLKVISNRGTKVWPAPTPPIHLTDVFGCRFLYRGSGRPDFLALLGAIEKAGLEWVHLEKLHELDGKPAYSAVQGE